VVVVVVVVVVEGGNKGHGRALKNDTGLLAQSIR